MARISASRAVVTFPWYTAQTRGLINSILGFSGHDAKKDFPALTDISLDITDGTRLAVLGPNGAGKTTLLRLLCGVYEPTSGHILVEGSCTLFADLMLGMDPEADGYEFIKSRCVVMGVSDRYKEILADVERFTELGRFLQAPVRTYSSGMLLRLAFAVATAVRPDIMLMDEMIGVGDRKFMDKAQERIESLMRDVGILVLASHNEDILKKFCSTGIVVLGGKIVFRGVLEECLKYYADI